MTLEFVFGYPVVGYPFSPRDSIAFLSHFVSWKPDLAFLPDRDKQDPLCAGGSTIWWGRGVPKTWPDRNRGCTPFVAVLLIVASFQKNYLSLVIFRSVSGSWEVVSFSPSLGMLLVSMGLDTSQELPGMFTVCPCWNLTRYPKRLFFLRENILINLLWLLNIVKSIWVVWPTLHCVWTYSSDEVNGQCSGAQIHQCSHTWFAIILHSNFKTYTD